MAVKIDANTCKVSVFHRKVISMQSIANDILSQNIKLNELCLFSDAEVKARLSSFRGIGEWTAEMLMIFSMNRLNVRVTAIWRFIGAYACCIVIVRLFCIIAKYQRRFHPYNSVASLYLRQIASGVIPELTDPKPKNKPINPKQRTTK